MGTVELWNSLTTEVVLSLSLQVAKSSLVDVLRKLLLSHPYLSLSRRSDQRPAGAPSSLNYLVVL